MRVTYPPGNLQTLLDGWFPNPLPAAQQTEFVIVCDIGQGNFNVLVNAAGVPFFYFDLGGGKGDGLWSYGVPNSDQLFCPGAAPRFSLSHWDEDHTRTVYDQVVDNDALAGTDWLAPDQTAHGTRSQS